MFHNPFSCALIRVPTMLTAKTGFAGQISAVGPGRGLPLGRVRRIEQHRAFLPDRVRNLRTTPNFSPRQLPELPGNEKEEIDIEGLCL